MALHTLAFALAALLLTAGPCNAGAAEVEGVYFEDRMRLDAGLPELLLNGAGVRTKFIFRIYAIGLYLPQKVSQGRDAMLLQGPKRVTISIMTDEVTSEQFMTALREKLESTNGTSEGEAIRRGVDRVSEIMDSVRLLKRGHTVSLDFLPSAGTRVVINGEQKGRSIPGRAFFHAMLDGWIGENPVSESLKRALLGQET